MSDWERDLFDFVKKWAGPEDFIEVKTSGSTGLPKLLRHRKDAMRESARMTCDFLGLREGMKAMVCLSTRNIAGMMMVVRAFERDLDIIAVPPNSHPLRYPDEPVTIDFCAMVPAQVYNSLQDDDERLKLYNIKNIIIGGAPVSYALQQEIRKMPGNVWATFGMTETMSHIAMRKLNGPDASDDRYHLLEGITITTGKKGNLIIDAPYLPGKSIKTNDLVEITGPDTFRWLGRADHVINSGGKKIFPETVECIIAPVIWKIFSASASLSDSSATLSDTSTSSRSEKNETTLSDRTLTSSTQRYFIAAMPHDRLGEVPVLVVEQPEPSTETRESNLITLQHELSAILPHHEMPRDIRYIKKFIETPTGKIIRSATLKRLRAKG